MELHRFETAAELFRIAEPFLVAHEAENNLVLGILSMLTARPAPAYLAAVQQGEEVLAAAVITPPRRVVLSYTDCPDALPLLVGDVLAAFPDTPGVQGPGDLPRRFAELWTERTGRAAHPNHRQGIYQLDTVMPVTGVPGRMRPATLDDSALLTDWMDEFSQEALGEASDRDAARSLVEARLSFPDRGLVLWEVGNRPVSMAGFGGPTPHGIRIGPVYTPPGERGRGYASALTAALSQQLLDRGYRHCFLFTDMANPTSNHIYRDIGYRFVTEGAEWDWCESGS